MSRVYFITGTSSGFGRALAEAVLARGDRAVLTARRPESVAELVSAYPDTAISVRLDVTDAAARTFAAQAGLPALPTRPMRWKWSAVLFN